MANPNIRNTSEPVIRARAANCGSWPQTSAITIGPDGLGIAAYYDGVLRVAHCENVVCSRASIIVADGSGDLGVNPSITIGIDGLALIAYKSFTHDSLRVIHMSNIYGTPYVRRR